MQSQMKNKVMDVLKNNKRWCLLLICLVVFIVILENVFDNEIVLLDTNIYNTISLFKNDTVTAIFKMITQFGSATILICFTILSFVFLKNKKISFSIALNLIIVGLFNQVLKWMIQRPRPEGFRLIDESGYSFPSGHSMASMAFYGLIIYFVFKNVKNKTIKAVIGTILSLLILLIGMSRIYLGVHYASDVIAGFALSIAYLIIYITIILNLIEIS